MIKTLTLAISALLLAACAYTAPPPPPGAYYPDASYPGAYGSAGAGHPGSGDYAGPRPY